MKKAFFSFAVAAVAALAMASCGGNKGEKAEAPAEGEQATEQTEAAPAAEAAPAKIESRGQAYQVAIPADWESKQYASNMIVTKGDKKLDFKEGAKSQIAEWEPNMKGERQADITVDGRTWQVYKNEGDFKVAYLAQVNEAVVRVGSNVEDINDAEVLQVLKGVREYQK